MKLKLYNKIFESDLEFRKSVPSSRSDQVKASMGDWENQEEINQEFRELVKQEADDLANIKFDRDGNKYIDLNHLSSEAFKCTDFSDMFNYTWEDQARMTGVDVSGWDVSRGKNFSTMFRFIKSFNCDLSKWDVSQGKNFYGMFIGCLNFNSDLSNWDVSNGVEFSWMFDGCHNFNSSIGDWDVSSGVDFSSMFDGCISFDQDLSRWSIPQNARDSLMFRNCPIPPKNLPKKNNIKK